MKITLIIGLPASGKTEFAKKLDGFILDDPKSLNDLPKYVNHLIITDPNFCDSSILNSAISILLEKYKAYDIEIEKIYFENDPIQCSINSKNRINKSVLNYISILSKIYVPDEKCKIIPVYKNMKQKD